MLQLKLLLKSVANASLRVPCSRLGVSIRNRVKSHLLTPSDEHGTRGVRRVRDARRSVIVFFVTLVAMNFILSVGMDLFWPRLRDAEYVEHVRRAQARFTNAAGQPTIAVLGSSRMALGVRPMVTADGPVIANMSLVGSGPMLQLLALERILRDGVVPTEVLAEFWPPFLNKTGRFSEYARIDPHRFFAADEGFVREFMPDPEGVMALLREVRRTPVWCHRLRLMSHLLPTWLPLARRFDTHWVKLDESGWLPGSEPLPEVERQARLVQAAEYYKPCFAEFAIEPNAARAYQRMAQLCQERGIRLQLVWLPESSEFRAWSPPAVTQQCEAFLKDVNLPLLNLRDAMSDRHFADGYHLTTTGAAAFTKMLFASGDPSSNNRR
jgi:hypothetical protein